MNRKARETPTTESWWERYRSRKGFVWALMLVILIPILFLLWIALLDWIPGDETEEIPDSGVPLDEITGEPEAYLGQTVIISGEISEVVSPQAVVVEEENVLGGSELLVAGPNPIAASNDIGRPDDELVREGDLIRVTGTVEILPAASIDGQRFDEDFNFLLRDPALEPFEGQPVLLLESIDRNP